MRGFYFSDSVSLCTKCSRGAARVGEGGSGGAARGISYLTGYFNAVSIEG
ncbi:MAG: hypothetical protein LBH47_01355 [Christensenellaceae bacterium]|nr:hypothetical protein [Christensenellaceae bacterium]